MTSEQLEYLKDIAIKKADEAIEHAFLEKHKILKKTLKDSIERDLTNLFDNINQILGYKPIGNHAKRFIELVENLLPAGFRSEDVFNDSEPSDCDSTD